MQRKLILVFLSAGILAATLVRASGPPPTRSPRFRLPPAARAAAAAIIRRNCASPFLSLDCSRGAAPQARASSQPSNRHPRLRSLAWSGRRQRLVFQRVPLYGVHTVEDKTKFSFSANGSPSTSPTPLKSSKDKTDSQPPTSMRPSSCRIRIDAPSTLERLCGSGRKGKNRPGIANEPPSTTQNFLKVPHHLLRALDLQVWRKRAPRRSRRAHHSCTDLASTAGRVRTAGREKSYLEGDPRHLRAAA